MKFTLSWLKEHLQTDASLKDLEEAMTMAGLEVEDVIDPAAKLGAFSVARIVSAAKHPNADKLQVCQVETKDGLKEIVCGAPNARAGLVTAYAPLGTYIPGSGITLEARPVRGVVSNGMLCSGAELEVDADADGILEFDPGLAVGAPVAEALGLEDVVVDFEVTPNRPDWLGVAGIARDLAAAGLGEAITPKVEKVAGGFPCPVKVKIEAPEACPIFSVRMIRGVKNGPSPAWLQRRLRAIGLRPRNILVDITNLIAFDRARPLHVFDVAKLKGDFTIRMAKAGETLAALDGKTYELSPSMCVIADGSGAISLGGVIGGESTGCSDATVDVLIESAWFEPLGIFATGRATGIGSDAQYRFARGVDPGFVVDGLELASRMILDLCGGEASDVVVAGKAPPPPAAVAFNPARVKALVGIDLPEKRIKAILEALGFTVKGKAPAWSVQPPSWRRDVEGPADLVEEIARVEGFDKIPAAEPPRAAKLTAPPVSAAESRARLARRALAGAGYLEAVSWSFCPQAHAALFGGGAAELVLANPIAAELDCMRPTALPNLLRAAQRNLDRGHDDARLFEVGPAYAKAGEGGQRATIAAIWQPRQKRHWQSRTDADVFAIKADLMRLLEAIGAPTSAQVTAAADPWWLPGQSGAVRLGNQTFASFGAVHPKVLAALDVEGPALAFEVNLDALPTPRPKAGATKPPLELNDLMPLSRDFAFLVAEKVAAAELVKAAAGADKALIADVTVFDVYRGPGVPEGQKSLAIEVTIQPKGKTMTDAEIEALSAKIIGAVMKATGGALRG